MTIASAMRRVILVLLLVWISAGCYVPVNMNVKELRQYYPATRDDFTPGKTSRVDVLLKMGEPDELSSDEKVLFYRWGAFRGIVSVTGCDATPIDETTTFVFTFDEEGVLTSLDIAFDE